MTLADKLKGVAKIALIGSIGAVIGYVANDVAEDIGKMQRESAERTWTHQEYMEINKYQKNLVNLHLPPIANYPPSPKSTTCMTGYWFNGAF